MVNLILKDGNRHVDPLWDTRPVIVEILRTVTGSRVPRLTCPAHKSQSRATLLMDVKAGKGSWQILDFCCESFCRAIAERMPSSSGRSFASRLHKAA